MKLTIGNSSTPVEVKSGLVNVDGATVKLFEYPDATSSRLELVLAYHMNPGDRVRRVNKEEYVVEF